MSQDRIIRVAMAGFGTVGSGVAEITIDRGAALTARTGLRFEIVRALVSDITKARHPKVDRSRITDDLDAFNRTDADMVVEVMGGTTRAREVVLSALNRGIPVVTANKALLALHGAEVFETARKHGACVAFEASCAGGLPIVGALLRGLQANRIDCIQGIFNSTCNFVLTQMLEAGATFATAVAAAQRAGYAEADPSLDVEGTDTAHKLTVLASIAFGLNLDFAQVDTVGIDKLDLLDLRLAKEMGHACKLIGTGARNAGKPTTVALYVRPTLVPNGHPFAGMSGTSSAILTRGDAVGETFYAGAGAGALPTASAVVADMIEVASGATKATFDHLAMLNDCTPKAEYLPFDDHTSAFYVRIPGGASGAELEEAWKSVSIEIETSHHSRELNASAAVTKPTTPRKLKQAIDILAKGATPVVLPLTEPRP